MMEAIVQLWDSHVCYGKGYNHALSANFGMVVNRPGRTFECYCQSCGQHWEYPDGPAMFNLWAKGYEDATQDAARLVMGMPTPERSSWVEATDGS